MLYNYQAVGLFALAVKILDYDWSQPRVLGHLIGWCLLTDMERFVFMRETSIKHFDI